MLERIWGGRTWRNLKMKVIFTRKCIRNNSEYIFSETHGSALNAETGTII